MGTSSIIAATHRRLYGNWRRAMARRRTESVVLSNNGWATRWRCQCGYDNTGRDRCLMCNGPAPMEFLTDPTVYEEPYVAPPVYGPPVKTGTKANRTVMGIILANLAVQLAEFTYFAGADVPRATAVKTSLFVGLVFYAITAFWVLGRSASLKIRPFTGLGPRWAIGAAEGAVVGGVAAVLLVAALRLITGHPVLDPSTAFLASQGSGLALLLGFVVIVVAAPLVEELVFRGFMAESYRRSGKRLAIILSAAAFSLAHLSLPQLRYYLVMGIALGVVYWRRGLVGSIATHAAFNGVLLAVALAAAHGPAVEHHVAGATVAIPGTYGVVTAPFGNDDLVANGPLGASVEVAHVELPGAVVSADALAQGFARGAFPLPDQIVVDVASVAVFDLPAGRAVSMEARIGGRDGRVVILPRGSEAWLASYRSDGSTQSSEDFDDMLRSLTLPATSTAAAASTAAAG
jgi:membrane protease YdiL (CAAX protease family)